MSFKGISGLSQAVAKSSLKLPADANAAGGRYRYFSTPVICPGSSRRYASTAAQRVEVKHQSTASSTYPSTSSRPKWLVAAQPPDSKSGAVAGGQDGPSTTHKRTTWRKTGNVASGGVNVAEEPYIQEDPEEERFPTLRNAPRYDWRQKAISQLNPEDFLHWKQSRSQVRWLWPSALEDGWAVQDPSHQNLMDYTTRFLPLIDKEQLAHDAVLEERVEKWPIEKLKEEGYCITDIQGFWSKAKQFGFPIAVFTLGPGEVLPWHRFKKGDQIRLSRTHPKEEDMVAGSVVKVSETQIHVVFDQKWDLKPYKRIDIWSSDIAAQRMRQAISFLKDDLEPQLSPENWAYQWRGTSLKDALLRTPMFTTAMADVATASLGESAAPTTSYDQHGVFSDDQAIHSWVARYLVDNPVALLGDPEISDLDPSQVKAMAHMIGKRISLIQGPPGTGKTRTIAEAVRILKKHFKVPQPVLLCTYTNVAVDNLVDALIAAGLNPLRVGSSVSRINERAAKYSMESRFEEHPITAELTVIEEEIPKLEEKIEKDEKKLKSASTTRLQNAVNKRKLRLNGLRARHRALKLERLFDVVYSADVICTTCITAASTSLRVIDFPVVFLDEASMCTEPASLIPIMKGCQHLALIGDHKQLPPVVTSQDALNGGFGVSLFERLISSGQVPSVMLDKQYRMHPEIASFPSAAFYDNALQNGISDSEALKRLSPPQSKYLPTIDDAGTLSPIAFLSHTVRETRKDKSRMNEGDVEVISALIKDLLLANPTLSGHDIGIIAPYAGQITHLGRLLRENSQFHLQLVRDIGRYRAREVANIEVKTVDGFEGREKDVIIFSTVRSNPGGYIGFLADPRRLNVGLTRAKRALFIVGNAKTLRVGNIGAVEGAGLVSGAGAKNVKVDLGVSADVATFADVSMDDPIAPSRHKHPNSVVWEKYMDWLDQRGLVIDVNEEIPSPN